MPSCSANQIMLDNKLFKKNLQRNRIPFDDWINGDILYIWSRDDEYGTYFIYIQFSPPKITA